MMFVIYQPFLKLKFEYLVFFLSQKISPYLMFEVKICKLLLLISKIYFNLCYEYMIIRLL